MKLNSNKLKRSLLGLMAMTMILSTSSAITVYAGQVISGDGHTDTTETSSGPPYNGDEGEGNGANASGYTFAACKPAQQGLRVTFLNGTELMYKDKPSCVDICYSTPPAEGGRNKFYDMNKLGNAKATRIHAFTVGAEGNHPDLMGLPAPIGWDYKASRFVPNGLAIKDYLYPDDPTKTKHMNTLLTACFGKDALDDFRNAENPRVVLEAIAWYEPVTTKAMGKKAVGFTVYGTTTNWAEFNSDPMTIKMLGNDMSGSMSAVSNIALPVSMILSVDDPLLKLIVPGKTSGEIPTRDLL